MAKIPVREEHPRDPRLGVRCAFTTGERKHHGPLFGPLSGNHRRRYRYGSGARPGPRKGRRPPALCDLASDTLEETASAARALSPGLTVSTFLCDVADEGQMQAFQRHVADAHGADAIHLLFNNAGIGGGGTITDPASRPAWDKTFSVCWNGVLNGVRCFMPMLLAAEDAHIINTASINGFWASIGPQTPHTAYSAAKFAVKDSRKPLSPISGSMPRT